MARLYLRSSVAAGHPGARGDGLDKRLLQAAEGGDAQARCNLGILYSKGLDDNEHAVEVERTKRGKWLSTPEQPRLPHATLIRSGAAATTPVLAGSPPRS